jgi:hypothetical protein
MSSDAVELQFMEVAQFPLSKCERNRQQQQKGSFYSASNRLFGLFIVPFLL